MKKSFLILGIAGCMGCMFASSSCSEYDDPSVPANNNAISLSATVPNGSRATTTTATIQDFMVYAYTEGSCLIDGAKVTRQNGTWTYSPVAYWPVNPVNFYAYSPEINTVTQITGESGAHIPGYMNSGSVDLLYSVHKNVIRQAAPVSLNFRHALSKVSILLSSTNSRIRVAVSYVALRNVYTMGSFDFPEASTLPSTPDVVGSWSNLKTLGTLLTFAVIGHDDKVDLTPQPTDHTLTTLDCSYVIPQPLTEVQLSDAGYTGTFIEVDCEIFDTATGAKLWPNAHTPQYMLVAQTEAGRIVYPASSSTVKAYQPGHAYIYNIEINNPDVLDKIEFDVSVDDYTIDQM